MANILETIAEYAIERVKAAKEKVSLEEIKAKALSMPSNTGFPFERSLKKGDITFICECKKASPSKGLIAPEFPYLEIARDYEAAGAGAISVLTEPKWFLGSNDYLKEIAAAVSIPVLRKDFTVDEYMIYEAKTLGASAVLLICSLLSEETLKEYIGICDSLGLSALVEAHDEDEIAEAIAAGARIIGVNNRNLKDFTVDIHNSERLRKLVPANVLFIAESGIKTAEDIEVLRGANVNGALIGETLMRAENKKQMLDELRGKVKPRIKICGMRRIEDIQAVNEFMPDYCGMILSEGFKRTISIDTAAELKKELNPAIAMVGVYVNEPVDNIVAAVKSGIIDMVQLHGNEDETVIQNLRKEIPGILIIKAFKIKAQEDVERAIVCSADYLLLDNGTGTGQTFDWSLIEQLPESILRKTFLAGGLNRDNVRDAMDKVGAYALDTSSGVETEGVKDRDKIKDYIETIRR